MADDTQDGPPDIRDAADDRQAERRRFFEEIAELKRQRNEMQTLLAECRRENRELRATLGRDDDDEHI